MQRTFRSKQELIQSLEFASILRLTMQNLT